MPKVAPLYGTTAMVGVRPGRHGREGIRGFGSGETIELPSVGGDIFGDHGYINERCHS